MAHFLWCPPNSDVWYDFGTTYDEVYLSVDCTFDSTAPGSPSTTIAALCDQFFNLTYGVDWFRAFSGIWEEEYDTFDNASSPAPQPLYTWQTLEYHYLKNVLTEAWLDGTLIFTNGEFNNASLEFIQVGTFYPFSGGTVFIDNVKVGTTRGGTQIFSDDFESGNLSAWSGTDGSPEIVTSFPAPPAPPKPINTEVSVAFTVFVGSPTLSDSPHWTQIDDPNATDPNTSSDIVSGFRIDRGRASEFDKTGSGTASIDIIDTDGIVDPTNESGPHFGFIQPMRQVRIRLRNPVTDEFSYLFKGFASEWKYEVDVSGAFTKSTLDCADAFDLLSALEMTPGHHGDTPPANSLGDIFFQQGPPGTIGGVGPSRIHKALDDAGWPAGPREIFPGNVLLQETIYARRDQLLSVIFDAADAEFPGVANVYISKSGYVTFHGRYVRFDPTNPDYGIQFWKVGTGPVAAEDASVAPISGLTFRRSKSDIINAAMSVPQLQGGGEWTTAELATMLEKDDDSIARYGWRSDSFDNLLTLKGRTTPDTTSFPIKAVEETKLFSKWRVQNYSEPRTRIDQLVFRPQQPDHFSGPAIWALMCGVEIGDIVSVHTHHPGGGGFGNEFGGEDFFVEGIHYDVKPGPLAWPDVTLTLDVSPRSLYTFNPFAMEGAHAAVPDPTRPAAIGPLSIIGGKLGK